MFPMAIIAKANTTKFNNYCILENFIAAIIVKILWYLPLHYR